MLVCVCVCVCLSPFLFFLNLTLAVRNTPIMTVTDMSKGQSIIFICIYFTNMTTENIFREICCVKKDGREKHIRVICEHKARSGDTCVLYCSQPWFLKRFKLFLNSSLWTMKLREQTGSSSIIVLIAGACNQATLF